MSGMELVQGTDEWRRARCGSVGASQIHMLMARTKSGWGASRANLAAQLIAERLTGMPIDSYQNEAMRWGTEHEAEARAAYEAHSGELVETVGLLKHPRLAFTHASPDGLVGDDGMVEIKCMQTASHIDLLLSEVIEARYHYQMQWQMACSGRKWVDFFAWDPRMPAEMRLYCRRLERDDKLIADLEKEVGVFLTEVAQKLMALTTKFDAARAA